MVVVVVVMVATETATASGAAASPTRPTHPPTPTHARTPQVPVPVELVPSLAVSDAALAALGDEADGKLMVFGNRQYALQVITNLLSNAIKFTSSGSVALRVFLDVKPVATTRSRPISTGSTSSSGSTDDDGGNDSIGGGGGEASVRVPHVRAGSTASQSIFDEAPGPSASTSSKQGDFFSGPSATSARWSAGASPSPTMQRSNLIMRVAVADTGCVVVVFAGVVVVRCQFSCRADSGVCDLFGGHTRLHAVPSVLPRCTVEALGCSVLSSCVVPPSLTPLPLLLMRHDLFLVAVVVVVVVWCRSGIRKEDLPRVMQVFGQARRGRAVLIDGSGLGLPIAKKMVRHFVFRY